jgi:hypothetical protein
MYEVGRRPGRHFRGLLPMVGASWRQAIVKWRANRLNPSFKLMLSKGSQAIEIIGTIKEFVACFVEPRLSSQVSQDFSRVPVFLGFRGRRKNFDHVDFPQSADQAGTTHLSDFSS